jgi:hypothetical protein
MAEKKNPLFVHAIILCVLGGALAIYGSIDMIKGINARDALFADQKARSSTAGLRSATRMPKMSTRGGARGVLSGARRLQMQGSRMKSMMRRFARFGPALILGIGMIAMGVFLFKRKDWARIVSFGLLGAVALSLICVMSAKMGGGGGIALPLISIILLTFAAAKLEWDLMVESFAPA